MEVNIYMYNIFVMVVSVQKMHPVLGEMALQSVNNNTDEFCCS